jgi:hypothetical protein
MASLASLWLPIVLGAVSVFIASSLVHMVFRWHQSDYRPLPDEEGARTALGKQAPTPGQYVVPYCPGPAEAQAPEMQRKFNEGPVAVVRLLPNGAPAMGRMLGQWFALNLAVAFLTAYVAAHSLAAGAPALTVLRVTATVAFLAYAAGSVSEGIWMGKPWGAVSKDLLDALIYGFATALPLALLWPANA